MREKTADPKSPHKKVGAASKDLDAYGLIFEGEEMLPCVQTGDMVVAEPNREIANGDLVVAKLADGRVLVRWYQRKGSTVRLVPENRKFRAIRARSTEIVFAHKCCEIKRLVSIPVKKKSF
jgi:SOS-response transcriptional repressor LexA